MAEIKIIGNVINSTYVNRFSLTDTSIVGTQTIPTTFDPKIHNIEYAIYDAVNNFLYIDYEYDLYNLSTIPSVSPNGDINVLEINPEKDIQSYYSVGEFNTQYNFFKNHIGNYFNRDLFIKEISPDRTELKISSIQNKDVLEQQTQKLIDDKNSVPYLKTYLLNFGNNVNILTTNFILDSSNPNESYILFKLYEPLPLNIFEKDRLWVVEEISNSLIFEVLLQNEITPDPTPKLKGPNFDIEIVTKNTLPTQYESYSTLLQFTGSSLHAILNHLDQTSIDINVDYTNFSNFVRFGSAQKRVENFYYKVKQIENYNNFITTYTPNASATASLQIQINTYSASINDIVSKFDGYESYLYFQTGSNTYPHSNNIVPYTQQSTGSAAALAWYTAQTDAAIYYDTNNQDNLIFLIPEYLRIDEDNIPYLTFVNMIGHYFDNIYIYLKSVTDLYKSYNNLEEGVSKDLVYYALQDLGVDIHNSSEDDDLSTYTIAVSGSNVPSKDLVAELYKRIYHNIPLLFKGKGSKRGMQEFITTFGITGSILGIKEYGGDSNTHAALVDYSNSKVRVINNAIYNQSYYGTTGSVLLPDVRLATDNTYTNYKNDSDRVDISFSPYNQIDTTISASIASTYPTFSIDDYIGDPRNASQTEYSTLNSIRKTAIDSSFTFKYDINGFIQLIKFFDNTLFKMLKSYVPAKANLNEGITIRQQALERIKFKRNEPNATEQTVYDAEYSSPEITEDNTYLYNDLSGNKSAFYTGDITGSYINIGEDYAVQENPYLFPTGSIDQNIFNHTDYNVLLNNVSSSRLSLDRFKIETIPTYSINYTNPREEYINIPLPGGGGTSIAYTAYDTYSIVNYNILTPVELQDSYESLTSYQLSRHDGVKLTGLKYNTYSTKSATYSGDISYGNNAVVDRYSSKIGIFTSVDTSSVFLQKSDIDLKYLVDKDGNLTELNGSNFYWQDIQSIFKDKTLTVSLFDTKKFSNQKGLNGIKPIFASGYSYHPILYYTGSDRYLYFQTPEISDDFLFSAKQVKRFITNTVTSASKANIYDTFNDVVFNTLGLYHTASNTSTNPSFTSSYDGSYVFSLDLRYTYVGPFESPSGSFTYGTKPKIFNKVNGAKIRFVVSGSGVSYSRDFNFQVGKQSGYRDSISNSPFIAEESQNMYYPSYAVPNDTITNIDFYIYDADNNQIAQPGDTIYTWWMHPTVNAASALQSGFLIYAVNNTQLLGYGSGTSGINKLNPYGYNTFYKYCDSGSNVVYLTPKEQTLDFKEIIIPNNTGITLASGSGVEFILEVSGSITGSVQSQIHELSIDSGKLNVLPYTSNGNTLYQITGSNILTFSGSNFIIFTSSMYPTPINSYYYPSASTLYPYYGDIEYSNPPVKGDIISFKPTDLTKRKDFTITNTFISGGNRFVMEVSPSFFNMNEISSSFLILTRKENETNVVINYNKQPGPTSYGYIIPTDVNPNILDNINVINEKIKQRLLADQQGNTTY